jgi:phosphoribosylformylglycinamidine synthase
MSLVFKNDGDAILLIGEKPGWLGQSLYLRDICGREEGAPPPVDLALEKRHGEFVRKLILDGQVTAVHDLSDGGLAVAIAEMAMAGGLGASLDKSPDGASAHGYWFGEDQARYVVTAKPDQVKAVVEAARVAGVTMTKIGTVGGNMVAIGSEKPVAVADLSQSFEAWLPEYMAGTLEH